MNEYIQKWIINLILPSILETVYMVFFSSFFSIIIGILLGITLYVTEKNNIMENIFVNKILSLIVNTGRSIPFVIIIIATFPLARIITGSGIGVTAAIVPLTIAAFPFVSRIVHSSLKEIDKGVVEASISMGASNLQIITKVLLFEAAQSIINGITLTVISILGYSAMAGMVGGGGLGDVANRYGAQRYRVDIIIIIIIIMVIMVQIIQVFGDFISKYIFQIINRIKSNKIK
jgi:D-methionine transport system permease protein